MILPTVGKTNFNWPLRVPNPHFQNEAEFKIFLEKMSYICMRLKNHLYINGFALSLALKQRMEETRKRPNPTVLFNRYRFKLCEKKTKGNELKLPYKRTVVSYKL